MPDLWFGRRPPPFGRRRPPFGHRYPPPRSRVRGLVINASPGSWFGRLGPKNGPGWTKREPGNPGWMKSEPQVLLRRLVALPASGLDALPSGLRGAFLVVMLGARVVFRCDVRVTSGPAAMLGRVMFRRDGTARAWLRCPAHAMSRCATKVHRVRCVAKACYSTAPAALPRRAARAFPLHYPGALPRAQRLPSRCPNAPGACSAGSRGRVETRCPMRGAYAPDGYLYERTLT